VGTGSGFAVVGQAWHDFELWILDFGFFINEFRGKKINIEEQVILWWVGVRYLYYQIFVLQLLYLFCMSY